MVENDIFTLKFGTRSARVYVDNKSDGIQTYHQWGLFYEANQLQQHADLVFHGSTVIDVGANVGNHTIFYAACTTADRVYPFEPNLKARAILEKSLSLNDFGNKICAEHIHFGLGKEIGRLAVGGEYENALGATHYTPIVTVPGETSGDDEAQCVTMDSLSFEGDISLIKIDVEGMEIDVLQGAAETIARHRPSIAVEVNAKNTDPFWKWVHEHKYTTINMFYESKNVRNYIIVPTG